MSDTAAEDLICETPRLVLRKLTPDDFDAVSAILCDPEVMKFSPLGPETREGVMGFLAATQRRYRRDGVGQWAVLLKSTKACIGLCGICAQFVDGKMEHELGYRLARPYWGKGLATESASACRDYGFGPKGLPRLISIVQPENKASVRVAEKIGMTLEKRTQFYGADVAIYSLAGPNQAPAG